MASDSVPAGVVMLNSNSFNSDTPGNKIFKQVDDPNGKRLFIPLLKSTRV